MRAEQTNDYLLLALVIGGLASAVAVSAIAVVAVVGGFV